MCQFQSKLADVSRIMPSVLTVHGALKQNKLCEISNDSAENSMSLKFDINMSFEV